MSSHFDKYVQENINIMTCLGSYQSGSIPQTLTPEKSMRNNKQQKLFKYTQCLIDAVHTFHKNRKSYCIDNMHKRVTLIIVAPSLA